MAESHRKLWSRHLPLFPLKASSANAEESVSVVFGGKGVLVKQ